MFIVQEYVTRKNIIYVVSIVITLLFLFIAYDNLTFRLKLVSPSLSNTPDSVTEIRYTFSQPVKSINSVSINGEIIDKKIQGKIVTIALKKPFESGRRYSIVFKNIRSEWFNNSIPALTRSFTPKYIPFSKLSNDDKRAQINSSNSGQVDDPFVAKNVFPIFNERWQIDAKIQTTDRIAVLKVKFFAEVPDYDNNGAVTRVSDDTAERYRAEVLNTIRKKGGNPDAYIIIYDNPYLYSKYST